MVIQADLREKPRVE